MDWDWPLYRRVERQPKRLAEMAQRLAVDLETLASVDDGAAYAEALRKCVDCRHTRECLAWLDAEPSCSGHPGFCPNLSLFRKCRIGPKPARLARRAR